jgi:uncharacterized membrane protein
VKRRKASSRFRLCAPDTTLPVDELLAFAHILAAFWYIAGLTAVQLSLTRAWQSEALEVRAGSLDEASHYQGVLMVPGAIAAVASGLFLWAQLDYNLITTPWLLALEALYVVTLLVCLPLTGIGLRRARLAALQARKAGQPTPQQTDAMRDAGPLVAGGLATLLVPVMAALSVFQP